MNESQLMGRRVEVTATLERCYGHISLNKGDDNRRWWESRPCEPWIGWLVGFRFVQEGVYRPESGGRSAFDGDYDPAGFRQTGTVKCALVAAGPRRNAVKVPMDGWRFVSLLDSIEMGVEQS